MKRPLIIRSLRPRLRQRERGVTMILVAVAMVAIVAMAALSIDVVTLYLARMEAQRAADAGALAAARVISISGLTGDPANSAGSWNSICGGSASAATLAADAAATQSAVNGASVPTPSVKYSAGAASAAPDCTGMGAAFAVNPLVTVTVTKTNLPSFFSRVWGNTGNKVTATAVAEAFNSAGSGNWNGGAPGTIVPVQPRCVKPWIVPNQDPQNPGPNRTGYCNAAGGPGACQKLVDLPDGKITNPGISLNGAGANGVIGETFWISPDCRTFGGAGCRTYTLPPQANYSNPSRFVHVQSEPNLLFLPGQPPPTSAVAVPSCAAGESFYQQAIAGCDQSTQYQCGVVKANTVDMSVRPDADTTAGVECLIHETNPNATDGQDTIDDTAYPFKMLAGNSNPLAGGGLPTGSQISASNSIVSLPIYDSDNDPAGGASFQVTIVGFLQVFISKVDQYGNINVTVLNVTGCSNGSGTVSSNPVTGSSPIPVRLITAP